MSHSPTHPAEELPVATDGVSENIGSVNANILPTVDATNAVIGKLNGMSKSEMPRERMVCHGADALSDVDLLAIMLRTGMKGTNVIELAREILSTFGSLNELLGCDVQELMLIRGLGEAKAVQLKAALELGRRAAQEQIQREPVRTAQWVWNFLRPEVCALSIEQMHLLLLDSRLRLMRHIKISDGILNEVMGHPREVFRHALLHKAYAVIIAHNHPSGDPSPSTADRAFTRRMVRAGMSLQIPVHDHVILGAHGEGRLPYFSFREVGLLGEGT